MDARAFVVRLLDRPSVVAFRTVLDTYGRAAGGLLANGLAFSALFAAIPATLLVLGLAGWFAAGDPTIRQQVSDALSTALPPLATLIRSSVEAVAGGAALTSVIGAIGVIWTISQLFAAVDVAFARIFFDQPERDVLRRTLRGFVVVGLIAATVIAAIASLALVATLDALTGVEGSPARSILAALGTPPFLAFAASLVVIVAYRKLPPTPPSWGALVIPAVIVGAMLVVLGQAFTLLVPWLVGVANLAGSLASGFVALAWLSLSFQALLLGASWVRVRNAGPPTAVEAALASAGSASLKGAAAPAEPGGRGE
jgi:membrane protein